MYESTYVPPSMPLYLHEESPLLVAYVPPADLHSLLIVFSEIGLAWAAGAVAVAIAPTAMAPAVMTAPTRDHFGFVAGPVVLLGVLGVLMEDLFRLCPRAGWPGEGR